MRLGVISDTHGTLREQVLEVFARVDRILHAGDVGDPELLERLAAVAPVTAVYGNTDGSELRARLPRVARLRVDGMGIVVTHGDQHLRLRPEVLKKAYPDADVVVFGHTHEPLIRDFPDFSVVLNPGAAGPTRGGSPPTVAVMETEAGIPPRARIVPLTEI